MNTFSFEDYYICGVADYYKNSNYVGKCLIPVFWDYTAPVTDICVVTEKCEKLLDNDLLNGYLIAEFHKKTAELDYVLENNYGIAVDEESPVCKGKITFYKSEDNKIYVNPAIEEV